MIAGIGVDLVDTARIARLLDRHGERFATRILTDTELPAFRDSVRPVLFLASRFAGKEALSKALGTGLRYPVTLHAVSVVSDGIGQPRLHFHGDLPDYLKQRGIVRSHLSLSHERDYACAMVVIEALE